MSDQVRSLKQHFTDAKPINELMCYLLGSTEGHSLLEPSVGHGAFLSGITGTPSRVDVVDVDADAIQIVTTKFGHLNVKAFREDFIDIFVAPLMNSSHPIRSTFYDLVISNPPYGLYFDLDYRKQIKRAFPDTYARESYGLFFKFAVSQLRPEGRYVFLIPDTFLSSVNHRPMRSFMCSHAAPTHIIRFPSRLFETVNFGYANLCVVAGERRALRRDDFIQWLDAFQNEQLLSIALLRESKPVPGSTLIEKAELGWSPAIFDGRDAHTDWRTLGEIAECRTGIYTGDNARFIGYDAKRIRRRQNGHSIDWQKDVRREPLKERERYSGLVEAPKYVPLIRGGHREPFDHTAWAIDWSNEAINFYRSNPKARLQNSKFYFRSGLSVPMVTTKRISAALMDNAIFDQGVVGVFPHHDAETDALLLYLNSGIASKKVKALVNGSANNSANYLKRLLIPRFSDKDLHQASEIVSNARLTDSLPQSLCDDFVTGILATLPSQIPDKV